MSSGIEHQALNLLVPRLTREISFGKFAFPISKYSSYRLNETFAWPAADGGGGGGGEPFPLPAALLMAWMPKTCNGTYPYYANLPGADM